MKRILTVKHWQLFLLIVITGSWTSPSPLNEIINAISFITFNIWIYSIVVYGHERIAILGLPTLNIKRFKTNIILISILIIIVYLLAPEQNSDENQAVSNLKSILFIPITLYLVFAISLTVIFACKTLAILELKREVTFGDYFVNLILIVTFIIGVWVIQPKVTKLIADDEMSTLE